MANKLELTWYGKDEPILVEPRLLIENAALSNTAADPDTENMLIHGDNLLALKALEGKYAGQVNCIYIDPPYNTGSAFEHYDDNLEHSQWLQLTRPRLEILWRLLSEEGSIWISIDDDEQAYMKVLCDELFGRSSFVASIIWQKRTSPDMRAIIKVRLDKIIAGEDPGGITKSAKWEKGGGYRFYELAPTLINEDAFGEAVINPDYDADMLAAGVALHEGFTYHPDGKLFWKQSSGSEKSYLFVTTRHLNSDYLDSIQSTMEEDEYLTIACCSYDKGLDRVYDHITVKKIPQMLLERCEFGKTDYNLNIVHPPVYEDEEEYDAE